MFNCDIGKHGENIAINYLSQNNYKIIDSNFRNKTGEIDIICKTKDIIVFVEVKTRYSDSFGKGCSSVNFIKQKNIINVAKYYISINKLYSYFIRFDVIDISLNIKKDGYNINHIIDAFRLN